MISLLISIVSPPGGDLSFAIAWFAPILATAGGTLLNNLFSSSSSRSNTEKALQRQYDQQVALMDKQHELNKESTKYASDLNQKNWFKQFGAQAGQNAMMMSNGASIQRAGLTRAGLNPNSDIGAYSGNVASGGSSTASAQGVGLPQPGLAVPDTQNLFGTFFSTLADTVSNLLRTKSDLDTAEKERAKLDKETQVLEEERLLKQFENQGNKEESIILNQVLPDTKVYQIGNEGHYIGLSTLKGLTAWKATKKLESELEHYDADAAVEKLRKMVAKYQGESPKVLSAIANQPVYAQKEILSSIAKAMSEVGLNVHRASLFDAQAGFYVSSAKLNDIKAILMKHQDTYELIKNVLGDDDEALISGIILATKCGSELLDFVGDVLPTGKIGKGIKALKGVTGK